MSLRMLLMGIVAVAFSCTAEGLEVAEVERWLEDLQVLRTQFLEADRSFTPEHREQFLEQLTALARELPQLTEPEVIVRTARALAISNNGHTMLHLFRGENALPVLPIRAWWFADGLYIIAARPEHEGLLGARIVAIAAQPIENAKAAVSELVPGNNAWKQYAGLPWLLCPTIHQGLGWTTVADGTELMLALPDGTKKSVHLATDPVPPERDHPKVWENLDPARLGNNWRHVLGDTPAEKRPLYLRQSERPLSLTYLAEDNAIYLRQNVSRTEGEDRREVVREVLALLKAHPDARLVVDLRFNTGGDLTQMRGAYTRILREPALQRERAVSVITGPATFSAGLFTAAYLKDAGALVVGEPVGDFLDFWAEGGAVQLPNAGFEVSTNDGFHSYSTISYPELSDYVHTDLNIESLEPEVPEQMSFAAYCAGEDPLLDAALKVNSN